MKTNQGSCLWPCGLIVQISRKKCRTFLDLVSFKAFLRRFSSFSSSLTSNSSALLWGDLLVWSNYNHLSKVAKKKVGGNPEFWVYQAAISLSINCKSEEASSLFCTRNTLVSYNYQKFDIIYLFWYFAYCTNRTFCIVPTEHVSCWQLESVTVCKDWFFLKIWSKAGQL